MLRQPFTWVFMGFFVLCLAVFLRQYRLQHGRWPDARGTLRKPYVWIIVGLLALWVVGFVRQQRLRREQWTRVQATLALEQQKGLALLQEIGPPPNAKPLGPPEIYRNSTPNQGLWRNAQVALSISASYRSTAPPADQETWLRERLLALGFAPVPGSNADSPPLKARKGNWEVVLRHQPHTNGVYPDANLRLSVFWDYTTRNRDLAAATTPTVR